MGKLLEFEFAKLIKSKVFYICFAVCTALVILMCIITDKTEANSLLFLKSFGGASMLTTILAIPVCCFVCEDAQCGAEKTVLGRGTSRTKFFFAKYISSLVATILFTLAVMGVTCIAGLIKFEHVSDNTIVPFIFLSLLGAFMYHGLFFGCSTITGKNGIAISIGIMAPMIMVVLCMLLDYFFKIDNFTFDIFSISTVFNKLSMYTEMNKDVVWAIVLAVAYPMLMVGIGHEVYVRKEN